MVEAQKTLWLINQYASTPQTGMGGRHYYLARELARQGHRVYLIAAGYTHLLRELPEIFGEVRIQSSDGFHFVWLRMPKYSEAHSKKRVYNWFLFAWLLGRLPGVIPGRPDAILYSSPSLVGYLGARRLARRYGVPLTFELRDIWPLTLTGIGGYSRHHPFIRFLQWIEDKAYRESARLVSNLENAVEHIRSRGGAPEKFAWLPNGFSADETDNLEPLSVEENSLVPANKFKIGYTGTLGRANDLDVLIAAAQQLREYEDIVFVLVGKGREKPRLQRLVREKGLANVIFVDPIAKARVQTMLARFDVCFIGWRNEPMYRFGIGANKIPEYFLSGRPVLHAYSGKGDPVAEAGAGLTVPAGDAEAVARAVLTLKAMAPEQRAEMGRNGRAFAAARYEYGALAVRLAEVMLGNGQ